MNITRENIDDLNAVVKVDIAKEDYNDKVEKILKDYQKTADTPGFRKGKVPMGMIKKQFGQAVLVDEVNKLLQDNLNKYLTEEKLNILGNPIPKNQEEFNWDSDPLSFEFELGLSPKIEVNLNSKEPITHYKIVADDEMIENQVKTMQRQYGKLISKEAAEEGDQVVGTFRNEAEEIENRTTLSLEKLKGKENLDKFIGAKPGDIIKVNTKDLVEDEHELMEYLGVDHDKIHGLDIEVEFEVSEVNHQELAELDQEFFDKIFGEGKVKTVTELKDKIKEDAAKQFEQQSEQHLLNSVTEMLIENTKFDLPVEFLEKWLQTSGEQELSEEEAKEEFKNSEDGLRYQLIQGQLIEDHGLEVNFEELKDFMSNQVKMQMAQFGQMDPEQKELDDIVMRIMSNEEEVRRISEQVMNEKLLEVYKEKANLEEKEVTFDEFAKEVYK